MRATASGAQRPTAKKKRDEPNPREKKQMACLNPIKCANQEQEIHEYVCIYIYMYADICVYTYIYICLYYTC